MMVTSRGTRIVGMLSVTVVAVVAAVVSYAHMQAVAERAGEGWRSWLEPLSVDGLLVGASLVLYVRRSSRFAWLAVTTGLLVSLAANLAAAHPTLVSRLVSAWPAIALALSYETLLTLVRRTPPVVDTIVHTEPETTSVQAVEHVTTDILQPPRPAPSTETDGLVDRARQLITQARRDGTPLGRTRLAREMGIDEAQARRLLNQLTKETKETTKTTPATRQPAPAESGAEHTESSGGTNGHHAMTGADPYAWMRTDPRVVTRA